MNRNINKDNADEQEAVILEQPEEAAQEPDGEAVQELGESELLQQKLDELGDKYLRLLAEYDNFRKRTQREKDEMYRGATAAALEKILPILDNFQRASGFDPNSEDFAKGIELIAGSFLDVLKGFGVESFGEAGDPFDPNLHYAVSHIEDEALGENVLSQVLQPGYRMGEKILRFAMVQTAN